MSYGTNKGWKVISFAASRRLSYIGHFPRFQLSIFGHPTCDNLPFGNGNGSIGCPSNTPGWVLLGEVQVSGIDEWIETEINFLPTQNISAVAIGQIAVLEEQGWIDIIFLIIYALRKQ